MTNEKKEIMTCDKCGDSAQCPMYAGEGEPCIYEKIRRARANAEKENEAILPSWYKKN